MLELANLNVLRRKYFSHLLMSRTTTRSVSFDNFLLNLGCWLQNFKIVTLMFLVNSFQSLHLFNNFNAYGAITMFRTVS